MRQGDWLDTLEDIISCAGYELDDGSADTEACWNRIESYVRFKVIYNYAPYLDDDYTDVVHEWHNARCGPLSYECIRPSATNASGLKLLMYKAFSY